MNQGIVFFVGAGPGHPGLITLRGVECLRKADVVLFDYLANSQLLNHAKREAELICLGRHRRADIWSQQAINDEMVRRAQQGACVVRLKGGDPMVFGRAAEELHALIEAGIEFEIVPGVTAATAAAAYAGVTVTDRRHASAVALVTGHEQLGKPDSSLDYESLANFPGTLVIYMGVRTAGTWSQSLLDAGKPAETPVLLIRRCSWSDQQRLSCRLGDVAERLTPHSKFPPPVIVIVGEAARFDADYDWFSRLPLLGKNVLVTRPAHQAMAMADRFRELGANALIQPAIEIREPHDWQAVDDAIGRLEEFDHIAFSSANGVEHFFERMLSLGLDVRRLADTKLAVIGPRTAEALRRYHLKADFAPTTYRAEALAAALIDGGQVQGKKVLLIRASRGREVLAEMLTKAQAFVEQVVAYQSNDVVDVGEEIDVSLSGVDWVTVTSSAIARSICRLWGDRLRSVSLASISPITSATLRELGFEPSTEASEFTAEGVVDAILAAEASAE